MLLSETVPLQLSVQPPSAKGNLAAKAIHTLYWRPSTKVAVPLITACFCIFEILRGFDVGILAAILPSIAEDLDAGSTDAYWTGSIYIISMTITQPIFAGVAQAFSRRHCLLTSVGIFIVASALCATARNIRWLIGTRLVRYKVTLRKLWIDVTNTPTKLQGIGAGGMDVSFSMIIVDLVSLKERPKYNTYLQVALTFGLGSGAIIGSAILQNFSWRL
jgi:MFS family permease